LLKLKIKMKISRSSLITIAASLLLASCTKENPVVAEPEPAPGTPVYTVPATYEFTSSAGVQTSTKRVGMTKEIVGHVRSAHTSSIVVLSASKLRNMFANTASSFTDAVLNSSGLSLREKTNNSLSLISELEFTFDDAAAASQVTVAGSNGTAGKVAGITGTNGIAPVYLCNASGFEFKELVEKSIMTGVFYSEAMNILNKIDNYDNATVIAEQGTAMEKAWDEAFGYFGVPLTFPTTTTGAAYWGSYCNAANVAIGCNSTMMNAFLKGRAAIANKHPEAYRESRDIIVTTWEKIGACRLVTYLKQAKTNFANDGARNHALSEATGFIKGFRYNSAKKITDDQINTLLNTLGTNLYQVSLANLETMISLTCQIYSLDVNKL
jgi:hypothetical protein